MQREDRAGVACELQGALPRLQAGLCGTRPLRNALVAESGHDVSHDPARLPGTPKRLINALGEDDASAVGGAQLANQGAA